MIQRIAFVTVVALWFALVRAGDDPHRAAAIGAAAWLQSTAIRTPDGLVWPSDPRDPKTVNTTLYAGTPGPILFFLELARETGDKRYLETARAGADALLASIPTQDADGLYQGLAGIGFTLGQAWLVTGDAKYKDGALTCVDALRRRAKTAGGGVEWNGTTDIISGGSGIGLFLLWADEQLKASGAAALAAKAGARLIELGKHEGSGRTKWMMDAAYPAEMPNFSHGTAGVAYFMATLHRQTREPRFLGAATAGANYLISIAETANDACLIYHDSVNKQLYYLSWCHGPAGTARLFYRLNQVTRDPKWLAWVQKLAKASAASGAPDRVVTPGEWNNISVCCGVTGQAQFFLDMHQVLKDPQYLDLATRATALLVSKSTTDRSGLRWVQAEHRVRPDLLIAQTGYMQGASGVGLWLLHFSAFQAGSRKPVITLPDNPFVY